MAWLGALAYTFQIYFDFSGYSDMAIGIGRALGFTFPENFNYPYCAKSVTEFWRRWHISLSSWFKDYVYIPLGGNRKSTFRTCCNLLIVFILTGLWHGANWTFLAWGLWHGAFLLVERLGKKYFRWVCPAPLSWIYCTLAVVLGWVLFRSNTLHDAGQYLKAMFDPSGMKLDTIFLSQINGKTVLLFLAAIPIAAGSLKKLCGIPFISQILAIITLGISYIVLVSSSYNPFIYFRF